MVLILLINYLLIPPVVLHLFHQVLLRFIHVPVLISNLILKSCFSAISCEGLHVVLVSSNCQIRFDARPCVVIDLLNQIMAVSGISVLLVFNLQVLCQLLSQVFHLSLLTLLLMPLRWAWVSSVRLHRF